MNTCTEDEILIFFSSFLPKRSVERTKAGAARLTRAARVRVAIRGLKRCCWSGSLLEEVTHTRAHINDEKNSGASWRSACTEDEEDREVATMRD